MLLIAGRALFRLWPIEAHPFVYHADPSADCVQLVSGPAFHGASFFWFLLTELTFHASCELFPYWSSYPQSMSSSLMVANLPPSMELMDLGSLPYHFGLPLPLPLSFPYPLQYPYVTAPLPFLLRASIPVSPFPFPLGINWWSRAKCPFPPHWRHKCSAWLSSGVGH